MAQLKIASWRNARSQLRPGRCPLYPQKRTLVERVVMSALCQKLTLARLFDHLARPGFIAFGVPEDFRCTPKRNPSMLTASSRQLAACLVSSCASALRPPSCSLCACASKRAARFRNLFVGIMDSLSPEPVDVDDLIHPPLDSCSQVTDVIRQFGG